MQPRLAVVEGGAPVGIPVPEAASVGRLDDVAPDAGRQRGDPLGPECLPQSDGAVTLVGGDQLVGDEFGDAHRAPVPFRTSAESGNVAATPGQMLALRSCQYSS
ncbi:MAG: hypothetical protein MK199_09845, partial [Acidimicrobiales bacterium]|nr:hypothetical protein [Acidimicrobiales bacterium]